MAFDAPSACKSMIDVDAACGVVAALARPLGVEPTPLEAAHRRVLAAPVIARHNSPPSPVSAMDGYAVRDLDLEACPTSLRIVGESFAGDAGRAPPLQPGCCIRVFTGAALPEGADRVVIQEVVQRVGDRALIAEGPKSGRNVRAVAADFAAGETLLAAGTRLTAQTLVTAAAADTAVLSVFRRPRVAILATGDELTEPGTAALKPGAIAESVSFGVAALASDWGGDVVGRQRVGDDLARLNAAAAAAVDAADVIVVIGGASVGERDHAKAMFEPLGLELIICKVAMKPGKPVWVGRARGCIVVGLPGNPSAAMVTARLFLAPLLAGLGGRDPRLAWAWRGVHLAAPLAACADRETFVRARATPQGAEPATSQDSSAQMVLATSDLLLRRRAGDSHLAAGETVDGLIL